MAKHTGIGDRDDGLDVALSLLWQRHGTEGERVYGEVVRSRLVELRRLSRYLARHQWKGLAMRKGAREREELWEERAARAECVARLRSLLLGK